MCVYIYICMYDWLPDKQKQASLALAPVQLNENSKRNDALTRKMEDRSFEVLFC